MTPLLRAWTGLVALSIATTVVALSPFDDRFAGVLILAAAWAKARLIFLWYLGLAPVEGWRTGILLGLAGFSLLLLALYLLA